MRRNLARVLYPHEKKPRYRAVYSCPPQLRLSLRLMVSRYKVVMHVVVQACRKDAQEIWQQQRCRFSGRPPLVQFWQMRWKALSYWHAVCTCIAQQPCNLVLPWTLEHAQRGAPMTNACCSSIRPNAAICSMQQSVRHIIACALGGPFNSCLCCLPWTIPLDVLGTMHVP